MERCCQQPENRETVDQKDGLTVQKCVVCGRKHYELTVDPVKVGLRGGSL